MISKPNHYQFRPIEQLDDDDEDDDVIMNELPSWGNSVRLSPCERLQQRNNDAISDRLDFVASSSTGSSPSVPSIRLQMRPTSRPSSSKNNPVGRLSASPASTEVQRSFDDKGNVPTRLLIPLL
ncbi:hypothetical protein IV203_030566 [Nitzschia inconspicua]|uniref:Uncharacterized protein n=1 Tax=Nitzschia inconspicua TaxID=303405 RepID=A0A9K3KC31_9STRA|nr:hypothetical protein IV203_022918 [Nitzschia inconspicua]KAG7367823.1 hypothetical protein IV203_030566 [Nitzschia inconspicua]